jgi:hypothetical protein
MLLILLVLGQTAALRPQELHEAVFQIQVDHIANVDAQARQVVPVSVFPPTDHPGLEG